MLETINFLLEIKKEELASRHELEDYAGCLKLQYEIGILEYLILSDKNNNPKQELTKGMRMNGQLKYMHYRKEGSTAICGRTGQHTTKKKERVTCMFCKEKLDKLKSK